MGQGSSERGSDLPGLSGHLPAPYLLVYDAEDGPCRQLVDRIQKRDRDGLIVAFPFQNAELVHVAPELAGLSFQRGLHGYDPHTRSVQSGPGILPALLSRLSGWRWLAPLARIPVVCNLLFAFLRRRL